MTREEISDALASEQFQQVLDEAILRVVLRLESVRRMALPEKIVSYFQLRGIYLRIDAAGKLVRNRGTQKVDPEMVGMVRRFEPEIIAYLRRYRPQAIATEQPTPTNGTPARPQGAK